MSTILHSLYGRFIGTDKDGYVTGLKGSKWPAVYVGTSGSEVAVIGSTAVTAATSATTGTAITAGGVTTLSSAASTWSLSAPIPGITKYLFTTTTSTLVRTVTLASGNFQSTAGSSFITQTFYAGGQGMTLLGLSTALYQIITNTSSAAPTT